MTLREEMIEFRAKNNLNQTEAAKRAKITLMTWGSVERGIQSPSKLTESKIRMVLDGKEVTDAGVSKSN